MASPSSSAGLKGRPSPSRVSELACPVAISICVCTFKRPEMAGALLEELLRQKTEGKLSYEIIVVDNDCAESARRIVEAFQTNNPGTLIRYSVEPEQSIALARNRTVAQATGELVAFIDDDEIPADDWLLNMYEALVKYRADGVLGPVEPRFTVAPPKWMLKAGVFQRPNGPGYTTGSVLHWKQTGTGNVLIQRRALEEAEGPFRPQFGSGGEDMDFFRRAMSRGRVFVWCDEALVHETVPTERTRLHFQLKRALLRGKTSLATPAGRPVGILKSVVACCIYSLLLPLFLLIGRHVFLRYLIRSCDHLGKLLAFCRLDPVRQKYVLK